MGQFVKSSVKWRPAAVTEACPVLGPSGSESDGYYA